MGYRTTKSKIKVGSNKNKSLYNANTSYTEFYYHFSRNILVVALPLLVISAIILSSLHSSATGSSSGTDNLTISISSACTLSSVIDSEHNASINAGTYKDNIGKTTIKTTCNDNNGYSIYANGYSNNEEGNNRLINTLSSSNVIETGLNTSGDISSWAMKLNNLPDDPSPTPPVIESAYDDTYGLIPSSWTKVLSLSSGSTDMSLGSSFTTTYAVYANSRQYTGTYQGQVKYLLTHPYSTDEHIYYMQEVDAWRNTLALEQSVQAIDKRDGKSYWVTRLKDGNIWMTQNLDFDIDTTRTYTHNDTDLGRAGSQSTWKPNHSTIGFTGEVVPGWDISETTPYSADPGDIYYYTSNSASDDIKYTSLSACISAGHTEGECKHYHAGNYYNWAATMATNNTSDLVKSGTDIATSVCPAGWRLPSVNNNEFGISLAQYGVIDNQSSTTYTANGFNIVRQLPLYFVRAGNVNWNNNGISNTGIIGYYSSSTTTTQYPITYFKFENNSIAPALYNQNHAAKQSGYSIRCIAH